MLSSPSFLSWTGVSHHGFFSERGNKKCEGGVGKSGSCRVTITIIVECGRARTLLMASPPLHMAMRLPTYGMQFHARRQAVVPQQSPCLARCSVSKLFFEAKMLNFV